MAETTNAPERPLPLVAVALVNALLAVPLLLGGVTGNLQFPDGTPAWFAAYATGLGALLLGAAVGLWLQRRWGFGLLALAYMGSVAGLVAARQNFICTAAIQFPLFTVAARQWKNLR